jgi:hypothetical protein
MPLSGNFSTTIQVPGLTIVGATPVSANVGIDPVDIYVSSGVQGTLSTRTNDTGGIVTLPDGHGIVTGNLVDLHWNGGSRYGMTATVAGDAVTLAGGNGDPVRDVLPVQGTAIVAMLPLSLPVSFNGANVALVGAGANQQARVTFLNAAGTVLFSVHIYAGSAWGWAAGQGTTTPIDGIVSQVMVSNGSLNALQCEVKLGGLQSS